MPTNTIQRWMIAALLLAGPAGVYVGGSKLVRWRRQAYAHDAVSALASCLMGEVVVDDDDLEAAARQLRAVAIGGDVANDASWPGRCEPFVRSSERAVTALLARAKEHDGGECREDDQRCRDLEHLAREIEHTRAYLAIGDKSSLEVDELVHRAASLGLLGGSAGGAPLPPEPAKMLDHRSMRPLYEGDYLRLLTDPAGDESLSLLFYEQDRQYGLCRLQLGERSGTAARCAPLPSAIPVGLAGELLASEVGAPERMYAQGKEPGGWVQALYDVHSGKELSRVGDRPAGGFVWQSGTVAHLAEGPPVRLHRVRNNIADEPVELVGMSDVSSGPRLIWDEVVWTEKAADGRHRVMARRALEGDEPLGEPVELGWTPPLSSAPSVEVCRTAKLLVLLVGAHDQKGGLQATLLFRDAAGWKPSADVQLSTSRFGFTCRGDAATLSWIVGAEELSDLTFIGEVDTADSLPVGGRYEVHRLRCAAGHCKHDQAKIPLRRHSKGSRYVAGDAGDAMVVLWRSVLGDVRMKFGALDALADAPERPLFDDVEHDGFGWDLEGDPIIGRSGRVLVLLSRQLGATLESATYGFMIDADGAVTPMGVAADEL